MYSVVETLLNVKSSASFAGREGRLSFLVPTEETCSDVKRSEVSWLPCQPQSLCRAPSWLKGGTANIHTPSSTWLLTTHTLSRNSLKFQKVPANQLDRLSRWGMRSPLPLAPSTHFKKKKKKNKIGKASTCPWFCTEGQFSLTRLWLRAKSPLIFTSRTVQATRAGSCHLLICILAREALSEVSIYLASSKRQEVSSISAMPLLPEIDSEVRSSLSAGNQLLTEQGTQTTLAAWPSHSSSAHAAQRSLRFSGPVPGS